MSDEPTALSPGATVAGPMQVGTALAADAVAGFRHLHAGHCESGVTASMFQNAGFAISEPMVFGIGSGLFFSHFSFVRVMGHPLTTFRSFPGSIFKNACARLGITYVRETFRSPAKGMQRLDDLLADGKRVGLQVNIYWLPYIPRPMRVHFNGHNLLVLEKRGAGSDAVYIVSDPVMECLFQCPADALRRARFSGTHALLPRGLIYYPTSFRPDPDVRLAVDASVKEVCRHMLKIPQVLPWMGVQGIRHLGREIASWPTRLGEDKAREWLAGVVRMQEEIGTGGAGFRFIYAAYLQQAGEALQWPELAAMSGPMTAVGDKWRVFALHASRLARGRKARGAGAAGTAGAGAAGAGAAGGGAITPFSEWAALRPLLDDVAESEKALFEQLDAVRAGKKLLPGR